MVGTAEGTLVHSAAIKFDEDGGVLGEWQVIQKLIFVESSA